MTPIDVDDVLDRAEWLLTHDDEGNYHDAHAELSREVDAVRIVMGDMREFLQLLTTWDGKGYPPASNWATEAAALIARTK